MGRFRQCTVRDFKEASEILKIHCPLNLMKPLKQCLKFPLIYFSFRQCEQFRKMIGESMFHEILIELPQLAIRHSAFRNLLLRKCTFLNSIMHDISFQNNSLSPTKEQRAYVLSFPRADSQLQKLFYGNLLEILNQKNHSKEDLLWLAQEFAKMEPFEVFCVFNMIHKRGVEHTPLVNVLEHMSNEKVLSIVAQYYTRGPELVNMANLCSAKRAYILSQKDLCEEFVQWLVLGNSKSADLASNEITFTPIYES